MGNRDDEYDFLFKGKEKKKNERKKKMTAFLLFTQALTDEAKMYTDACKMFCGAVLVRVSVPDDGRLLLLQHNAVIVTPQRLQLYL